MQKKKEKRKIIESVNVRPLGETSVFRVSFLRRQSSLCFSDALSGLLGFFSSLRLHTHTPPSSFLQCVSSTPLLLLLPPQHPVCNTSRCLGSIGSAFGPCLPPPIKLQSCLTARPALNLRVQCEGPRSAPELSDRNAAQWPRHDTASILQTTRAHQASVQPLCYKLQRGDTD